MRDAPSHAVQRWSHRSGTGLLRTRHPDGRRPYTTDQVPTRRTLLMLRPLSTKRPRPGSAPPSEPSNQRLRPMASGTQREQIVRPDLPGCGPLDRAVLTDFADKQGPRTVVVDQLELAPTTPDQGSECPGLR